MKLHAIDEHRAGFPTFRCIPTFACKKFGGTDYKKYLGFYFYQYTQNCLDEVIRKPSGYENGT